MTVSLEPVPGPTQEVRELISELDAELRGAYSAEQRHGLNLAQIFRAEVLFFVARVEGDAVGCGGVALEDGLAEVKRMYVRPAWRGRGVARAMLMRLEDEARARGFTRLVLETGDAQLAAMRLYERAGFKRCGAFGSYVAMTPAQVEHSVFYAKSL